MILFGFICNKIIHHCYDYDHDHDHHHYYYYYCHDYSITIIIIVSSNYVSSLIKEKSVTILLDGTKSRENTRTWIRDMVSLSQR